MKKILFSIAFVAVSFMANALETQFFSVDFDKMELVQNGETYELLEISKKELVNGRVVTYRCMDQSLRAVAFKLLVSNKGRFLRFRKCVLESK